MATLSASNSAALLAAHDALVKSNAPQIPFDATIIEQLAAVAASTGFKSAGNFKEDARDKPISTLIKFIRFIGT